MEDAPEEYSMVLKDKQHVKGSELNIKDLKESMIQMCVCVCLCVCVCACVSVCVCVCV